MEINVSSLLSEVTVLPAMEETVRTVLQKAAELYGLSQAAEVSVALCDDATIHQLNRDFRKVDRPTDVLSFALNEGEEPEIVDGPAEELLGDIIISVDTLTRQAEEYGHSLERELAYLTIHGFLHLMGYDHETEDDKLEMRKEEEVVLSALGMNRS
uniref:rRNA maturation RNase YbeY n=2 Tax=Pelorhabdus rhamnosifermentans TaxID=2772457 RepID=UPI001C060798